MTVASRPAAPSMYRSSTGLLPCRKSRSSDGRTMGVPLVVEPSLVSTMTGVSISCKIILRTWRALTVEYPRLEGNERRAVGQIPSLCPVSGGGPLVARALVMAVTSLQRDAKTNSCCL